MSAGRHPSGLLRASLFGRVPEQEYAQPPTLADAPPWVWDLVGIEVDKAMGAGWEAGYAAGRAAGLLEAQETAQWAAAAQVARTVAGDRSRTWAPPGHPQRRAA